jgi:hypothetical protein
MKLKHLFNCSYKGVPEIVDPVEVEAQNEVPAEEHGFCLLDMDKGR